MKYKLIYFEWADATHPVDNSWYESGELKKWAREDSYWVKQCGWIIEENKEYILIASQIAETSSLSSEKKNIMLAQYIKIPKTWIKNRIELNNHVTSLIKQYKGQLK